MLSSSPTLLNVGSTMLPEDLQQHSFSICVGSVASAMHTDFAKESASRNDGERINLLMDMVTDM